MAWTDPRTWTDTELVTAAMMNPHVRDNLNYLRTAHKYKAADESVASSITLQNDDDLFFAVAANERWFVELALLVESNTTASLKSTFTVPSGTTIKWGPLASSNTYWIHDTPNTPAALLNATETQNVPSPAAGITWGLKILGIVQVGGTAGNVQYQWAQSAASGTTIIHAGSLLIAHRVNT